MSPSRWCTTSIPPLSSGAGSIPSASKTVGSTLRWEQPTTGPPFQLGGKVGDVEDEKEGTVRLKRTVDKADEMALDTASTKTTRIKK